MSSGSKSIYMAGGEVHRRPIALAMFGFWLAFVSFLAATHLVFRDEVRAFSKALQGENVFAMLNGIRAEGHPFVWYLLLRVAHSVVGRPEILIFVSVAAAAASTLILVLRAPFSLRFLGVLLMTSFSTYEYSVMARNYGISMLFPSSLPSAMKSIAKKIVCLDYCCFYWLTAMRLPLSSWADCCCSG